MLTESKNGIVHYFMDELGRFQGEYKAWHDNGVLCNYRHYVDDKQHGECKSWHDNGALWYHVYYDDDEFVHNFLENPLTDEEKMLLVLKYGAPLLPKVLDN